MPGAFKLLRDGPNSGGSSDHPTVSTNSSKIDINHPFVDCQLDGIPVRALVDTGSMKSFISYNAQRTIDFNDSLLDTSSAQQCVSITGDKLNILGQIRTVVNFSKSKSKVAYTSDFLVSDNIQYECVLGWDFLQRNMLALTRGPGKGYFLVGRHGKTSIRDNESTTADLAGVTHTNTHQPSTDRSLCQSTFQSSAVVALVESVIIPPRTEMILEGKLTKHANSKIGLIEPRPGIITDARQGFSLARAVVEPDQYRVVPLRVVNVSNNPIELAAGENIADFCPLVESCSKTSRPEKPDVCGAMQSDLSKTFLDKVNAAIDSSLTSGDREHVQSLLYKYSDVFDEKLGHTTSVTHKINTGHAAPIKQAPRRLPYVHREEAKRQIDEMLDQGVIRPSTSAWSSPVILIKKKSGELRFCVDYRKLNSVTVGHAHPLPRIDDILDSLGDSKYFTTLDLRSGYWQISVDERDRHKTDYMNLIACPLAFPLHLPHFSARWISYYQD